MLGRGIVRMEGLSAEPDWRRMARSIPGAAVGDPGSSHSIKGAPDSS